MTDIAQQVAIETTEYPGPLSSPSPGKLHLAGYTPTKVHVKIIDPGGGVPRQVGLASERNGTYYTGGLAWKCAVGAEYAKFITFVFWPNVSRITCPDLSYSEHYGASPVKQALCIPALYRPVPVTYHFNVYPASATNADPSPVDPEIVVTPL